MSRNCPAHKWNHHHHYIRFRARFPLPRVGLFAKSSSKTSSPLRTILRVSFFLSFFITSSHDFLGRPQEEVQVRQTRARSVLLLTRGHALCGWRIQTSNDFVCEDSMEEVQGTAACSFILPFLLHDPRSCVEVMRLDAACKRDLALDKARPPAFTTQ